MITPESAGTHTNTHTLNDHMSQPWLVTTWSRINLNWSEWLFKEVTVDIVMISGFSINSAKKKNCSLSNYEIHLFFLQWMLSEQQPWQGKG